HRAPGAENGQRQPVRSGLLQGYFEGGPGHRVEFPLETQDGEFQIFEVACEQFRQLALVEGPGEKAVRMVDIDLVDALAQQFAHQDPSDEAAVQPVDQARAVIDHQAQCPSRLEHTRDVADDGFGGAAVVNHTPGPYTIEFAVGQRHRLGIDLADVHRQVLQLQTAGSGLHG